MVGSLPFTPDAAEMQSEDGLMGTGNKESDSIISDIKSTKDSEEVVLIQYRLEVCGKEIRAQVLVEPRNGSVMSHLASTRGRRVPAGGERDRGDKCDDGMWGRVLWCRLINKVPVLDRVKPILPVQIILFKTEKSKLFFLQN